MEVTEGPVEELRAQGTSEFPVMVGEWAEAVIDLARWQSRRRHPSNREASWEKDGGYEAIEWVL